MGEFMHAKEGARKPAKRAHLSRSETFSMGETGKKSNGKLLSSFLLQKLLNCRKKEEEKTPTKSNLKIPSSFSLALRILLCTQLIRSKKFLTRKMMTKRKAADFFRRFLNFSKNLISSFARDCDFPSARSWILNCRTFCGDFCQGKPLQP
jgi:hypothetical protein